MHPTTTRRLTDAAQSEAFTVTYRGCEIYRAPFAEDGRPWVWEGIAFTALQAETYPTLQAAKNAIDAYLGDERDFFADEPMKADGTLLAIAIGTLAAAALLALWGWL